MLDIPSRFNIASWFIDRPAYEHPQRIAILGDGPPVPYGELQHLTNRTGNLLRTSGCEPGDRILIALPDSVEFVTVFFGAAKIGAIPVPVSPSASATEYSHYASDSGARFAIIDLAVSAHVRTTLRQYFSQSAIIEVDSTSRGPICNWRTLLAVASPSLEAHPTSAEDPAFLLYTSGSTGPPKAAVHLQKNMLVTSCSFARGVLGIVRDDRVLSIPHLFFAFGLGNGMYFPFSVGASTIFSAREATLSAVATLIGRYAPTLLFAIPSFLGALLEEVEGGLDLDLSSVRLVVVAGEALNAELFERFRRRFGLELLEGFGSTEMLQTFISNRPGSARHRTCGVTVPNYETQLIADNGQPVLDGDVGTLWVKGQSAFREYWNKPDLTSRAKSGEWVITGDTFYRDKDGYHYFCGRNDDMLKVSGMWISPRELEISLSAHPMVDQVVVVATERQDGKKHLVAYIVAKRGHVVDEDVLRRHLAKQSRQRAISFTIRVLAEWPVAGSGKIDRQALQERSITTLKELRDCGAQSDALPQTSTERTIAQIWSTILNLDQVGLSDDFIDLGGNSISAMQCLYRLRSEFAVDISLSSFFSDALTVRELAAKIDLIRGRYGPEGNWSGENSA